MNHIPEIAKAIADGRNITKVWDEATINQEMIGISDKQILQVVKTLFPTGIPVNLTFYESLKSLQHYIGFGTRATNLLARIWYVSCTQLTRAEQLELLQILSKADGRVFWMGISCLPDFLSKIKVSPYFLTGWLITMATRVGKDLAGGPFYVAVQKQAYQFPRTAFWMLEKFVADGLVEPRLTLGAIILGTVRSILVTGKISNRRVKKLEQTLRSSPHIESRICQHRSWAISYNLGAVSIENLQQKLSEMLRGLPQEVDEAFGVVYHCLVGLSEDPSFTGFATKWLLHNASATIPGPAKHYVMSTVQHLSDRAKKSPGDFEASMMNDLIAKIQPIPEENQGTWSELEYYLVDRLQEGPESFGATLDKLANANAKGLSTQFSSNKLRYLVSEMSKSNAEGPITKLLLSADRPTRRLAIAILQKFDKIRLSPIILGAANELQLKTILLEFTTTLFVEKGVVEFLLALEPHFSRVSKPLQEHFTKELTFQAVNYPRSVLNTLKGIENPPSLINDAIASAEKYFDMLRKIGNSYAVSFTFPGFKELDEKARRALSAQISKSMHEQSVLISLVKHVQIVYGSTWSNLINGKLSNDNRFTEFQESIEFPRLESIDPEGMRIRRIQAALELQQLEAQH